MYVCIFLTALHLLYPLPPDNNRKRPDDLGSSSGSTHQMGIFQLLNDLDVIELDVQELIHGFQDAFDGDVVFEFDGHFVVDERFEEAVLFCDEFLAHAPL